MALAALWSRSGHKKDGRSSRMRRHSILVLDGANDAHVVGLAQVGSLNAGVVDG
jgi:hypothetical protein